MSTPSEITRSQQQTGLQKLSESVILKEQNRESVIIFVAQLINRLGKLYQIPGSSDEHSVILAEWVYDNYKFESLEAVKECLRNPPETFDEQGRKENNWRLTPDRIQKWMTVILEREAIKREKENEKLKLDFKDELPMIDYESYKKRIENGEALRYEPKIEQQAANAGFMDEGYLKFKKERLKKLSGEP
jgi:hypothetical protein